MSTEHHAPPAAPAGAGIDWSEVKDNNVVPTALYDVEIISVTPDLTKESANGKRKAGLLQARISLRIFGGEYEGFFLTQWLVLGSEDDPLVDKGAATLNAGQDGRKLRLIMNKCGLTNPPPGLQAALDALKGLQYTVSVRYKPEETNATTGQVYGERNNIGMVYALGEKSPNPSIGKVEMPAPATNSAAVPPSPRSAQ